ncbi:MAG TPA: type I-U CRISPR-associated helicase/endonuclease Cas3 [Pyrinomonadaceae bacterium]|jgi:CRISPR-associated endonuclease/helicase Cas3
MLNFRDGFKHLTEYEPFDWQERLFRKFLNGDFPDACDVPTGLGKTSVMAIWLIALGHLLKGKVRKLPLRLVYVVDRRVIVDQATEEAEKLWKSLRQSLSDTSSPLHPLARTLREASMKGNESLIALSTLRGQKADNREWCLDPSRPAIIVGTVDMIGSRLLFSGYGKVGINHRSLQAGLLGQDALVVIDEAHLSPVFVATLLDIKQAVQKTPSVRPFHVMSLSATLGGHSSKILAIDEQRELQNEQARRRLDAKKQIEFLPFDQTAKAKEGKKASMKEIDEAFAERLVNRVIQNERGAVPESAKSVVIFVRTVNLVNMIAEKLGAELEKLVVRNEAGESVDKKELKKLRDGIEDRILKMTGEMRGYERDRKQLVESAKFQAFLPERNRETPRPAQYLIATSSAEVGVNLDADDGLCDLSTLDSMIQRIGRINRFGETESTITVVVDARGLDAFASAYRKDEGRQQTLLKLTAEINQLQSRLTTATVDKAAKKEIKKAIKEKERERKKLEKKVADNDAGNIEPADAKHYFTWKALKAGEDETGRIDASPLALRELLAANQKALPDPPVRPPFDEARVDDWAMTSLKQSDYPRPLVQYWLRGVIEDESAQTTFVWRLDLDHFSVSDDGALSRAVELATAVPIQPKERANIATPRAADLLKALAGKFPDKPVVLINSGGETKAYALLHFKDKDTNYIFSTLAFSTAILPCAVGGLDEDGNPTANLKESRRVTDVIEQEHKEWTRYLIVRHSSENYSIRQYGQSGDEADEDGPFSSWQAAVRSVPKDKGVCENAKEIQKAFEEVKEEKEEEAGTVSYIAFFFNSKAGKDEEKASLEADHFLREDVDDVGSLGLQTRTVAEHDADVELYVRNLAERIGLPDEIIEVLATAGFRHDQGKAREWWQRAIGNPDPTGTPYAKSSVNSFDHSFNQGYRHEFGSLVESLADEEIKAHPHRDLILHLIAAHHGYARPHFPERAFDRNQPKRLNRQIARETMLRFNSLQRQYGWWQLAYLEAILKAADAMASRDFSRGELNP